MTVNQLALAGDSLMAGYVGSFGYQNAGSKGSFPQLIADRLAAIPGLGPLVSSGIHQAHINAQQDWAFTTGGDAWSDTLSTDAWDKGLYGRLLSAFNQSTLHYASGASKIATNTAGLDLRYPNFGWQLTWVDYASGTTATPSYSTDGGTTWVDFPDTPLRNNSVRKFYVASPRTLGSTVKIRGANAAGTAAGVAPHNIETFYQTPSTASGLIVHNTGVGGTQLHDLVAITSGDRMAWFDSVVLGSGSPIANTPNLGVIMMHINDVVGQQNKAGYATDLSAFNTRLSPLGPMGIMNPWECITSFYAAGGGNGQSDYRSQAATSAAAFSPAWKILDIYNAWASMGIAGNTQSNAAGFLLDLTHESQAGHIDLATRIYWWIRKNFLASYGTASPASYTVAAKQPTIAYIAKAASVAYLTGNQITPIPT